MDLFTEDHLNKWLKSVIRDEEERLRVREGIMKICRENPDLIERGDSWPEIRSLAERAGYIKEK